MACKLMDSKPVAFTHHLRDLRKLGRHHLGYLYLALHIVIVFLKALYLLHVLGIVGVVVVDIHGGQLIEAIDQHSLSIGINESQGTGNLTHSTLAAPVFDGFQQGGRNLNVIDEIEPAKAHLMAIPSLIGTAVNDGSHTSDDLPVPVSQEVFCLTTFKRRVFIMAERSHLVEE